MNRKWPLIFVFVGCYSVMHFILEFWRGDDVGSDWSYTANGITYARNDHPIDIEGVTYNILYACP